MAQMKKKKKNLTISSAEKHMEQLELSHTGGRHTNDGEQPLRKTVWQFLIKLNRHLPYDPAIPLLGICLKR